MIPSFNFLRTPHIHFGAYTLNNLPLVIKEYNANNVLLIIGKQSLKESGKLDSIQKILKDNDINYFLISVLEEPTTSFIDEHSEKYKNAKINLIISIGGGSVIDTGKALSAMLTKNDFIVNYLDIVGSKKHDGKKIPFIAIPTTAGTGSEATNNAVISKKGSDGFKRSLRHSNFIPDVAIVDPTLTITQPKSVTIFSGLDAFTQLLESYLSNKSTPMTDALSYSGLTFFDNNLIKVIDNCYDNIEIRTCLSYGALISGITLTNAGLGIIHGFASEIGGLCNIPHGTICSSLLLPATEINIKVLRRDLNKNILYLKKYAEIGKLISKSTKNDLDYDCDSLIATLSEWMRIFNVPKLSTFGLDEGIISKIIERVGQKNNPIKLSKEELKSILKMAI